jgi:hypothetical protein
MWKIAAIVGFIIFLVADSLYLYRRLKKYWRKPSWIGYGHKSKSWKLGLSSLDLPLNKQPDKDRHRQEKM